MMADDDMSRNDAYECWKERCTMEDGALDAIVPLIARDACERAMKALARLRGLDVSEAWDNDYDHCVDARRIMDRMIDTLQRDRQRVGWRLSVQPD
jgi:hypothetical protein